ATVKPSLLFLKKFTEQEAEEYEMIKASATDKFDAKYAEELSVIEEQQAKRGKDALSKDKKKELEAHKKRIIEQKQSEIKVEIKEHFDYVIPIAEIRKAGISTTGAAIENELIPLAEEFTPYRKEMKLWDVPIKETTYNLSDDGNVYRIRMADRILSEPEVFYGRKR
ncbi:MAG: N-6 DNA methylase, partial [Alphaproteobacteria bacterium]|nr:N-6 DNA methylase [Alphaproteobacteria bacterium]